MDERRSFVLYTEYERAFVELPPEEQGALIMAIFAYARTGEVAPLSRDVAMAFLFIRGQLDRDFEKYDEIREKRAEAGRRGGRQTQANRANASFAKQAQANQADNGNGDYAVYVDDTDNDDGAGNVDERSGFPPGAVGRIPPTAAEVKWFCSEQGLTIDAAKFVQHYTERNWRLGGGEFMSDWKEAVKAWVKRDGRASNGAAGARSQSIPGTADYEAENNFL